MAGQHPVIQADLLSYHLPSALPEIPRCGGFTLFGSFSVADLMLLGSSLAAWGQTVWQ